MTGYNKDINVITLVAIALVLASIAFQLLDGNISLSRLSFNIAMVVALSSIFLGTIGSKDSSAESKLTKPQLLALGIALVLGIIAILSSSTVGVI